MITTTGSHQRIVLSAVIALAERDKAMATRRLNFLSVNIKSEYFTPPYDLIYKSLITYYRLVGSIVSFDHFKDIVKKKINDVEELTALANAFIELRSMAIVEETDFRYQVDNLRKLTLNDRLIGALVETMDIATQGKTVNKKTLYGFDSAMGYIQKAISRINSEEEDEVAITNKDSRYILSDYADRKFNRVAVYKSGFNEVDTATGGFQSGDLVFIPGYTSQGKSTLLFTLLSRWVFQDGLNVAIGTAESSPRVVLRRLAVMQSTDPKYGQVLDYKKVKEGRLDPNEQRVLEQVVKDITENEKYGRFFIFPIRGATTSHVFETLGLYNNICKLDVFGYDYIGYAQSEVTRQSIREELNYIIKDTKTKTLNFDGKRGIVTVSPYAVGRAKWEKAVASGHYDLSCMAESSEAEKAADIVWSVLKQEGKTVGQHLKNRDGPVYAAPFEMKFDDVTNKFEPAKASGF